MDDNQTNLTSKVSLCKDRLQEVQRTQPVFHLCEIGSLGLVYRYLLWIRSPSEIWFLAVIVIYISLVE